MLATFNINVCLFVIVIVLYLFGYSELSSVEHVITSCKVAHYSISVSVDQPNLNYCKLNMLIILFYFLKLHLLANGHKYRYVVYLNS